MYNPCRMILFSPGLWVFADLIGGDLLTVKTLGINSSVAGNNAACFKGFLLLNNLITD